MRGVGTFGLDDVESETVAELHAGGAKDGSQRTRGAPLLADHFTDIAWSDAEPQYGYIIVGDGFYLYGSGFIDQGSDDFRHQ